MPDLTDLKRKTAELLDEGHRVGTLTQPEYERRTFDLQLANSLEAVEAVVADLVDAPAPGPAPGTVAELSSQKAQLTVMAERSLTAYDLGARSEVLTVMGSTVIDLAGLAQGTPLRLDLLVVMGEVTIRVPRGLQLEVDTLPIMGSCTVAPSIRAAKSSLRVHAVAIMGSLNIVESKTS